MEITAKHVENRTFITKGESNHWVSVDTRESAGGGNAASTPMELILMGLATCSGLDVVVILEKRRVQLNDFEVNVQAERAEDHPRVYTKIHLKYIIESPDLRERDAEKAVHLSQNKYCSVSAMLDKTAEITSEVEIIRPE